MRRTFMCIGWWWGGWWAHWWRMLSSGRGCGLNLSGWWGWQISELCQEQGVTKRCRLSLLTNSTLLMRVQMRGEGGKGVAGSRPMSTAVHITWHGAEKNFGILTYSMAGCFLPVARCRNFGGKFWSVDRKRSLEKTARRSNSSALLVWSFTKFGGGAIQL